MAFFSDPIDPSNFDMCGNCGKARVSCQCGSFRLFTDEDFNRWLSRISTPNFMGTADYSLTSRPAPS